jgi:hypothetical protein
LLGLRDRRRPLPIVPQHLLALREEAGLDAGWALGGSNQAIARDTPFRQDRAHSPTIRVLADQADQIHLTAQRCDVGGDVAGAAQHLPCLLVAQHWHGGLWRDAVDVAGDVAVQHDVADHQHAGVGEGG